MEAKKIVVDTSIIIDGKITSMLEKREFKGLEELIIPYAVLDELQAQASKGREPGFVGLDEVKNIRKLCKERKIDLRFTGEKPTIEDIRLAKSGRVDAMIRDVAKDEGALFMTADYVQALVGEAEGLRVKHIAPRFDIAKLTFKKYFTPDTMSVHLKEGVQAMAKRGKPGKFKLERMGEKLTRKELKKMIQEIVSTARKSEDSFIESERGGALVIQMENYRIAVARPPFSDGFEITIVRPTVKLTLKDYKLSEKLMRRLKTKAEGILIAGPPGSGKSTLASSLAEFYLLEKNVIVKTLESPRDLQVSPEITQYGPLGGDFFKTADLLLLVRPDYTIFDEIRQPEHFKIFSEMRLAGVGMIGVIHASEAVDAIQRFIGKVDLGMIPHVVDTVIFLKNGEIKNVFELELVVKVPSGMTEADLTRPVVVIKNFETGKVRYEIYTYGEQNVVVPVKEDAVESGMQNLARQRILQFMRKYDPKPVVEFISDNRVTVKVSNRVIPRLIGKDGMNIAEVEQTLGIHINVEPKIPTTGKEIDYNLEEVGNSFIFEVNKRMKGKTANIYIDDEYLLSVTVGKKGEIRVSKSSEKGRRLLQAIVGKEKIKVLCV